MYCILGAPTSRLGGGPQPPSAGPAEQWHTQKTFIGVSFSGVWCHLYLVCAFCDVIIWRHIHLFQTNVLARFALISHSRQNKDNCFGWSQLSRNTISNMRSGRKPERSAKSGKMVTQRRRQSRFPPKPNYYFLAHLQCSLEFHANSFRGIYIHSTN